MMEPMLPFMIQETAAFAGHSVTLYLMSERRFSRRTTALIWSGAFLVRFLLMLMMYITHDEMLTGGISYILPFVMYLPIFLWSSTGESLKKLFIYASYINYFILIAAVSQAIASEFVGGNIFAVIEFRLIGIALFCIVLVYDVRPAFQRATKGVTKGWGALTLLVLIFCICLLSTALISDLFSRITAQFAYVLAALFTIMLSAYVVIYMLIGALSKENRKVQLELESKLLNHQLASYEQMEREARKSRHDARHHNLLILEYAKNHDDEAIIRYLQEYEQLEEQKLGQRFCANSTVNSIVSAYVKRAKEQGIRMTTDIRMRDTTTVRDTDLVAILANLLENAEKGCLLSAGEHTIDLMIASRGQKLIIQCRNSCAAEVHFEDGIPRAVGRRGIGVSSVVDAASNYAGNVAFSAENGIFTGRVILNEPEEDTN